LRNYVIPVFLIISVWQIIIIAISHYRNYHYPSYFAILSSIFLDILHQYFTQRLGLYCLVTDEIRFLFTFLGSLCLWPPLSTALAEMPPTKIITYNHRSSLQQTCLLIIQECGPDTTWKQCMTFYGLYNPAQYPTAE